VRGWRGIPSLTFAFNWIYYAGWFSSFYRAERLPIAVAGAAGIILLPGIVALIRGLVMRSAVRIEECIVTALAGILGLYHLWDILIPNHAQALGFVLCGIALAAMAGLHAAQRRRAGTPILSNTLLALASSSLLLIIPASFDADGGMLAWALAAFVLADMGARARLPVLEAAAAICLIAGLWVGAGVNHSGIFIPVANRVFFAWFCTALAWFMVGFRWFRLHSGTSARRAGIALQVAASFMLVGLLTYEAHAWFRGEAGVPGSDPAALEDWRKTTLFALWALFPGLWLRWLNRQPRLWVLAAAHYAVFGMAFVALVNRLHHQEPLAFLNPVFLAALLIPAAVFLLSTRIVDGGARARNTLQIYAHLLLILLLSVELYQGLSLTGSPPATRYWIRMALISTAWAAYATALLGIGMSRDLRPWRWMALVLLAATLLKVFFVDMAEVRQIWRVLSFMVLGTLLMACSYAYSRRERKRRPVAESSATHEVTP
jgi:hypothetical protein